VTGWGRRAPGRPAGPGFRLRFPGRASQRAPRIHEDDQAPDEWPQKSTNFLRPTGGSRPGAHRRRLSFIRLPIFAPLCGEKSSAFDLRRT
jgi:hypothetical protein